MTWYDRQFEEEALVKYKKKKSDPSQGAFLSYSRFSRGCKALTGALGVVMYDKNQADIYISAGVGIPILVNWGAAKPKRGGVLSAASLEKIKRIVNPFALVSACANKALFFQKMSCENGPRIPEFTTNINEATTWAQNGIMVLGRRAHGSAGKDVAFYNEDPEGFVSSDLWLQYKKKKSEFRVHIMAGEVIMVQQKVLPKNDPDGNPIPTNAVDFRIRTHRTGFIFQKNDITVPDDVLKQAMTAFKISGLDFGAVDVIYNQSEGKAYVLEINTAPGLEETSVDTYRDAFRKHFDFQSSEATPT